MKFKIDGKEFSAPNNKTIFEVCQENGIFVPTLCHHPRLSPLGKCRVCVVELKGDDFPIQTACTTKVAEGLNISTNSPQVKAESNAAMRKLFAMQGTDPRRANLELNKLVNNSYDTTNALTRDMSLCVDCTRCVRACTELQGMDILEVNTGSYGPPIIANGNNDLDHTACISCGQCSVFCPTGAIREHSRVDDVIKALDSGKVVVVQTAPSVRVGLAEAFGQPAGSVSTGKMVAGARACGFHYVFDTNWAADATIVEEATEFVGRLKNNGIFPMYTSCCPAWINYVEKNQPELIPNLSSCKSPQGMFAPILRTYWANKMGIKKEDIYHVSIMPCTAKKDEIERKELLMDDGTQDIDAVITTRELAELMKKRGMTNWDMIGESNFDSVLGESSGAGAIFGATGGVMEAALRTAYELATGEKLKKVEFEGPRGLEGVKVFGVDVGGTVLKCAVVHQMKNVKKLHEMIKETGEKFHFIEVMACPGGCVSGGGQPASMDPQAIEKRSKAIYSIDERSKIRKSHENSELLTVYNEFLDGKFGSHKAHHLFHTHHHAKEWKLAQETADKLVAGTETAQAGAGGVLILYGSQSGNAAKCAKMVETEVKEKSKGKVAVRCMSMDKYNFENLAQEEKVAIVCSTYGQGEFPNAAKGFWDKISDAKMQAGSLSNVKFTVFGLGSSAYRDFNKCALLLDKRFEELGAQRLADKALGDDLQPGKYMAEFDPWLVGVTPQFSGAKAKKAMNDPPAPKYRLSPSINYEFLNENPLPPPGMHYGYLWKSKLETAPGYDREGKLFEFDIKDSGLDYQTGDHAGIMARNNFDETMEFIEKKGYNVKSAINVEAIKGDSEYPTSLTINEVFHQYLDFYASPSRKFFENMSILSKDENDRKLFNHLSDPENKKDFSDYIQENNYRDVLLNSKVKLPIDQLMSIMPVIQPRLYSIASSGTMHPDNIQLGIGINFWDTPKQQKKRTGLCTRFLWELDPSKRPRIAMNIHHGCLYLPKSFETPIVMLGLGTGIAPFRGFLQEREVALKEGQKLGPAKLYVGCRRKDQDYMFGDEFNKWLQMGVISSISQAFSRQDPNKRVHLNSIIKNNPKDSFEAVKDPETTLYYCGIARGTPEGLLDAFKETCKTGGGMNDEQANAKAESLQKKYQVECF